MKRALILFLHLMIVWLLLSGHYTPTLITYGVLSCAGVVALAAHLGILDSEALPTHFGLRPFFYIPWLAKEVVLSNLAVAKVILTPSLPIHPRILQIPGSQKTQVGLAFYANSITLTPGTITLDVRDGHLMVHALTRESAEGLLSGEMDRRVAHLEAKGAAREERAGIAGGPGLMSPFAVASLGILATMFLALVRAFMGPTVFDRILAVNMFGTKTVLLIAVSGFLSGRPEWLDLALLYALMNFTGMIALLRFSKFENLASDERSK